MIFNRLEKGHLLCLQSVSMDPNISVIIAALLDIQVCLALSLCWWKPSTVYTLMSEFSLSSQIFASVQDVLNCGLAGSTCGHFKDCSFVLPNGPFHKHCTNLHSCWNTSTSKNSMPFPLHSLPGYCNWCVWGGGGCSNARCMRVRVSWPAWWAANGIFLSLVVLVEFKYCLWPPSPWAHFLPFSSFSEKNNPASLYEENHKADKSTEEN